jgi:mannosyltransferase OCH1-like enzyme
MLHIPRVFHRIWLGGKPMPQEYVDFGEGWLRLNPDWIMRTWTTSDLQCGIPALSTGKLIDEARNYSQASDVLRHEILHAFGGVYIDTDFEALKPIEPYLENYRWVGAGEYPNMVSAGFIACTAQHPITKAILDILPERIRGDLPQAQATGPGMLTEVWKRFKDQPGVQAYPPGLFYPYGWKEKHRRYEKFPNAVAAHHWAGSWLENHQSPA